MNQKPKTRDSAVILAVFCALLGIALVVVLWLRWGDLQKISNLEKEIAQRESVALNAQKKAEQAAKRETTPAVPVGTGPCKDRCPEGMHCHAVTGGDSLWKISAMYYGSSDYWPHLAAVNGIKGPQYVIFAGVTCLVIPSLEQLLQRAKTSRRPPASPRAHQRSKKPKSAPPAERPKEISSAQTPRQVLKAPPPPEQPKVTVPEPQHAAPPPQTAAPATPPQTVAPTQKELPAPSKEMPPPPKDISALPFPAPVVFTREAQQPRMIPGQFWNVTGPISPVESGNIISTTYAEQGFTLLRNGKVSIVPFAAATITADEKGYDWNNRAQWQTGVKAVLTLRHGIIQAGAGYAFERRWKSDTDAARPLAFASYWFGWDQPKQKPTGSRWFGGFPGSTWGTVGTLSAVEKGNIASAFHAEQGVNLVRLSDVAMVPYAEYTAGYDTKGFDWNRRQMYGSGVKFVIPVQSSVLEVGGGYLKENRFESGLSKDVWKWQVTFWKGWSPRIRN